jgi:hypothetical protein
MDQTENERHITLIGDADSELYFGDTTDLKIDICNRDSLLETAKELVNGMREDQYGTPRENHERIAKIWSAMTGHNYSPEMVIAMMVGLKLARLSNDMVQFDTWTDIAGYAAIGWEVVSGEDEDGEGKNTADS